MSYLLFWWWRTNDGIAVGESLGVSGFELRLGNSPITLGSDTLTLGG